MARDLVKRVIVEGKAKTDAIRKSLKGIQSAFRGAGKSAGEASGKFTSVAARLDALDKKFAGVKSGIDRVNKVMGAAGLVAVGVGAIRTMDNLVQESQRFQDVMNNLPFSIKGAQVATQGLVDKMTLARSANQAVRLGVVKSEEEFAKLTEIAAKLGRSVGQDVNKSVEDLTTALARQSPMILDNLGISLKLSDAYKEYADQLNLSVDQLTDAQKKQAFMTIAMQRGEEAAAKVTLRVDEVTESWLRAKVAMNDISKEVLPFIASGVANLTEGLVGLSDGLESLLTSARNLVIDRQGDEKKTGLRGLAGIEGEAGLEARKAAIERQISETRAAIDDAERTNAELKQSNLQTELSIKQSKDRLKDLKRNRRGGRGGRAIDLGDGQERTIDAQSGIVEDINEQRIEQEKALLERRREAGEAFTEAVIEQEIRRAKWEREAHEARVAQIKSEEKARNQALRSIINTNRAVGNSVGDLVQTTSLAAERGIISERRAAGIAAWGAGTKMAIRGAEQTVEAVAAFASQNYGRGAAHVAAAAFATAQSILHFSKAAGLGFSGGSHTVTNDFATGAAFGGGNTGTGPSSVGPQNGPVDRPNIPTSPSGNNVPPPSGGSSGGNKTVNVTVQGLVVGTQEELGLEIKNAVKAAEQHGF